MSVMYVATLDILTEKGGFNAQAARAIGEAIDLEIARSRDVTASKEDVSECRRALGEQIGLLRGETDRNASGLRSELKDGIGPLRVELKEEMNALRSEFEQGISTLRTELKEDISALRSELKEDIGVLRTEMNTLRTDVKVEIQTVKADLVRWVFVVVMGQTAMLLGVLYFFIKYLK